MNCSSDLTGFQLIDPDIESVEAIQDLIDELQF